MKTTKPVFKGTFTYVNGQLDFVCTTKNISFSEVRTGLIKLRDDINRQLEQQQLCPFYEPQEGETVTETATRHSKTC